MFASLESFSVFFFISLAIILLGILFEEKLVALENKMERKAAQRKKVKKQTRVQSSNVHRNCARVSDANTKISRTQNRGFAA